MITNPRINGIRQQYAPVDDEPQSTLVTVVATSLAYAEVWVVARDGTARLVGRSVGTGKVDSAGSVYFPDGTVRLWLCCADPGASGSTSHTEYIDFPGALGGWGTQDHHMKDRIYERVTAPPGTSGTHDAIAAMDAAAVAPLQAQIDALKQQG